MIEWDVFISHASEDKATVARPLADLLAVAGVRAWIDEAELTIGDSLLEMIDRGLLKSQFGIVVLSPSFFAKRWPKAELDGLVARESSGAKVILPIWHQLTVDNVRVQSPILAGRVAVSTDQDMPEVVKEVLKAIKAVGRARVTPRPIFGGKLTKAGLMKLPMGSVLMRNTVNPDLSPTFIAELGGVWSREELWNRLRAAGAAGTKIYVFEDMKHARVHLDSRDDWSLDLLAKKK
jgi:hypothetical protein